MCVYVVEINKNSCGCNWMCKNNRVVICVYFKLKFC